MVFRRMPVALILLLAESRMRRETSMFSAGVGGVMNARFVDERNRPKPMRVSIVARNVPRNMRILE